MTNLNVRRFVKSGMFLLVAALGCQTLLAASLYVGGCGAPTYATIQAAVTASSSGANIYICPGTYPEQVTINHNVNLIGVKTGTSGDVVIASPAGGVVLNAYDTYPGALPVAAQVLVEGASNVTLTNITVDGSNNQIACCPPDAPDLRGIYYQNASGTINEVVARNQILPGGLTGCQSGEGIFVQSGYSSGQANVLIENSTVHSFQKNGITVDGPGAQGRLLYNYITGVGPTSGAAENGVQISDGATGTLTGNVVSNEIWAPDVFGDTGDAASGILIYSSENVQIENNTVASTQYGIVTVSDPTYGTIHNPSGLGDKTVIKSNAVLDTYLYDAIDLCSNSNTVQNNVLSNAAESGVHLDSSCAPSGNSNVVNSNTITESCAGVLNGGTSNSIGNANTYNSVGTTVLTGNSCPALSVAVVGATANAQVSQASSATGHPTPVR
jgi:parallel beta-helix repeat protein